MAGNFEEKLIDISSKETVKEAKALLKSQAIRCMYRDEEGKLNAAFESRSNYISTKVVTGDNATGECSCPHADPDKLCEHAVAAIMHCGKFQKSVSAIDDDSAKYSGLKYETLYHLASREHLVPEAKLAIEVNSEFPHVPSKWENSVLSVKLQAKDREYLGNINNLRQLYFEKTLTVSLKLAQFSLQDQQIIGYLAINGEPESSNVLLNSEKTAEFFHCLIGFDRFRKNGRRVIVHPAPAEPVILKKQTAGLTTLSPAIRVNGALLDLGLARVITGRSGCWVGRQGEYYFLPAKLDVGWIRNFFRTGRQVIPGNLPDTFLIEGHFPVPVISVESLELEKVEHTIFLSGALDENKIFRLRVSYIYDNLKFESNSGRLAVIGNKFYRRNEEAEQAFENDLEMFGFVKIGKELVLENLESIGIFLDKVMPMWLNLRPDLCLDAGLAKLCRGGAGLSIPMLKCEMGASFEEHYLLHYYLHSNHTKLSWREMVNYAREGRGYSILGKNSMVRLPDEFRRFLVASTNVISSLDEKNCTFELPFYSGSYWAHIGNEIPGAVPPELAPSVAAAMNHGTYSSNKADFEFKGELRSYQQEGLDFLRNMTDRRFNVILADEMGLGKTIQVLALLAERQQKKMPPSLVVCPASLLTNWEREAAKFVPGMRVIQLSGAGRAEIWDQIDQYDLVILSYAICRRDAEIIQRHDFNFVILDEAQHIKNPGTGNSLNCKAIRARHRIVLTGTPLENSSDDLWSIFDFLHPGMLGSFNSFKKYYNDIADDPILQRDLAARCAPFIKRRTKALVAQELPPKQELTLFCEMDAAQRKLYEEVRLTGRTLLDKLEKGQAQTFNTEIFTTLLRLRQICCHPALLPDMADTRLPSAKMELLHELLLENIDSGHKVLLFSQFTSVLAVIESWLKEVGIKYEYLDGATRNRQNHVDHFNEDESITVFLLSLKAGGTGLNLTSADTVIIYDPWWNPAVELQAADRTHRIGQTRPVSSIKLLVKDSIEEKILQLQEKKQEIFDHVIDNPNACSEKFSIEELRFLLE